MIKTIIAALLALLTAPALAQATPAERRMATFVEADRAYGEALLERLVNQNSGTLNLPGVRAVGDMLGPEFEALGFEVRWIDGAAWGRAGHLVATHRPATARIPAGSSRHGPRGRRVLMIGHLDTVFEPASPFQRYSREGNRAIGPGVGDDKGGIIVILATLRAMQDAGTLARADITVFLTGDEERVGRPLEAARADLIAAGRAADVALEYEGLLQDSAGDYGTTARRSSSNWTLTTTGRTGHSSTIFAPGNGYGAIYEMARILDAFRRELPEANLTYNVGVLAGGTPAGLDTAEETATGTGKTNIIASEAVARGDLRTLTIEQDARIRAAMQAIVDANLPETDATIRFDDGYPPMAPTPGNRALLALLNSVNRDMGLPVMAEVEPSRRGAADSGFVAPYVDTLGGLGSAGGRAHAEGEYIDLDSIPRQALRSAVLISRLSAMQR
jgi:glutamate carboxypeptidase